MLTGFDECCQDNRFWMTLTNNFPGQYSLGLLTSTTAIPKGSAGIFSVQTNPSTMTQSKSLSHVFVVCDVVAFIVSVLTVLLFGSAQKLHPTAQPGGLER